MKKIGDILSSNRFLRLKREGERLNDMRAVILQTLADNDIHGNDCQITEFKNGALHLQGTSAADIFRIRQILPTLQDSLKKSGFAVATIRVSVESV